ncbi:hypothetical protein [Arenimonas composti]|uniref:Autotransporter domain-containing protein n=1 Tax=Arenimonas composti TR7-09 = DSM 18010 TaxID=1121013 RepID=A0A091BEC3_9GAMM|nr:hypothetical protein [Arenimonas composti]KFN50081.1 hypothetical protein P873_00890 [Arenimonas composti TR7-09 = DSM 18010]
MRKNTEAAQVNSRRARKYAVAPVTRAIRAALTVSAATLALGGQALAADAYTTGHAPARHEAAQRDLIGPPVLDLTLAGGAAPSSVTAEATDAALLQPTRAAFAIGGSQSAVGIGSGLELVDDPSHPMADFIYVNNGVISPSEVFNPAIGINGDAGVDNVIIVNNGTVDAYSALNIADGIFGAGTDVDIDNNGVIFADGSYWAAGIEVEALGAATVVNDFYINAYAFGYLATSYGIHVTAADQASVINNGFVIASGDVANGIDVTAGNDAVVVNSGTMIIGDAGSYYASGIHLSSIYAGSTATAVNDGTVDVLGIYGATGIEVLAAGQGSAATIYNAGNVYAVQSNKYGNGAAGLVAASEGSSLIVNNGLVQVESGGLADGIIAIGFNGDATVYNNGDVIVANDAYVKYGVVGITAASQYGNAHVDNAGFVEATSTKYGAGGYLATGVIAQSGSGDASVLNTGDIVADGWRSYAIVGQSVDGDVSIEQGVGAYAAAGSFATSSLSAAVVGTSANGDVDIDNDGVVLSLSYYQSFGIYAAAGRNVSVDNSYYVGTGGLYAAGITALAAGDVDVTNSGFVYTVGTYSAVGINATADNVTVDNSGTVLSLSNGTAIGIAAEGASSVDVIGTGDVIAASYTSGVAIGIYAVSPGDVNVDWDGGVVAYAVGDQAVGIFAASGYGTTSVNVGGPLVAYSEYASAHGIRAIGVDVDVNASGTIDVDGYNLAVGISAVGSGTVDVTNSGDIVANVRFDTANEFGGYHYAFGVLAYGGAVTVDNSGLIDVTGDVSNGIYAIGGSAVSIVNSGDIYAGTLFGSYYGTGIFATSLYDGSTINVGNAGHIGAYGYYGAVGIEARAGGAGSSVSVSNSGDITAFQYAKYGNGAAGIVAVGDGDVSVDNSGLIQALSGGQTNGVLAASFNGDVSVVNSGDIVAISDYSSKYYSANGINAFSQFGSASVDNSGTVYATSTKYGYGYAAFGIMSAGDTGASVVNSGDVTAMAKYAYGIVATSANGDVTVDQTGGASLTVGNLDSVVAYGIVASSGQGDATVTNAGLVDVTSGDFALGAFASADYGTATVDNSGGIYAYGFSGEAIAIGAVGVDAVVNNSGVAYANGFPAASGIVAIGDTATVDNSGTVIAFSYGDTFGIRAQGASEVTVTGTGDILAISVGSPYGNAYGIHAVSVGDVNVDFGGRVYAYADYGMAIGIFGYSFDGDVSITNSGLVVADSGAGLADGIFASGANVTVDNSGVMSVVGTGWAAGIEAQGTDLTTVTNSGEIYVDVELAGIYYGENSSFGIFATGDQVVVDNSGQIIAAGDMANGIYAVGNSSVSITNSGVIAAGTYYGSLFATGILAGTVYPGGTASVVNTGDIIASSYYGTSGIEVRAAGAGSSAFVDNSGTIYAGQYSKYGYGSLGIVAIAEGSSTVLNSGEIEVWSGGYGVGIIAAAIEGDATVVNSGDIDVRNDAYLKYGVTGVIASSNSGNATIDNSGNIYVASAKYADTAYIATGLMASGGAGASITNSGEIGINGWISYGAVATSADGDVSVVNTADGTIVAGLFDYSSQSLGIVALSQNGDVSIGNAGEVDAESYNLAIGLYGSSVNGDVAIANSGAVDAYGYGNAVGAAAFSTYGDATVTNSGEIWAAGAVRATGIIASAYGTATVDNSGNITVGTPYINFYYYTSATGIDARGDVAAVNNSGEISVVSYDTAIGVLAMGASEASLANSGDIEVSSPYDLAVGAYVMSGGDVSISNSGAIEADSVGSAIGVFAYSGLDMAFGNSGDISATSTSAYTTDAAVAVELLALGNVDASNSGVISATSTDAAEAIGIRILSNGAVDFLNSGTITASHADYAVAVDLDSAIAYFENTGNVYVDAAIDGQVAVRGGDGTQIVINRGDITGALVLGGGVDIFAGYNGGEWLVNNATTDFGGGNDRVYNFAGSVIHLQNGAISLGAGNANLFENSGIIRVSGYGLIDMGNGLPLPVGPGAPEAVPSLNTLPFVNDGLITFLDGNPDDMLTVIGDFAGDGALAIDVRVLTGLSDLLYIDGSVVNGTTQVVNAQIDGRVTDLLDPITFAVVTGNSNANAFVGGTAIGAESDFLDYHLTVSSAAVGGDTEYRLGVSVDGLNKAGSLAGAVAPGAHSLINSHVGTWRQRMGVRPDTENLNGLGPWVRIWRDNGSLDLAHAESFGGGGVFSFDQDNDGREFGFNFDSGYGISWGVMVGNADAVQDLEGAGRTRIDADSGGVYVTWIGDHLYADLSWRGIDFDADMLTTTGEYLRTHGDATALSFETGWRGLDFGGMSVVPQLQYTRVEITNIDDVIGGSSAFEYDPGTSERLRVGLEFSRTIQSGSVIWTPYGSLNAIREFNGDNHYTVADFHTGMTSTEGTSAMVELGVGAQIHGWSITAGASWTDGGAQDSFVGGQLILRYTW